MRIGDTVTWQDRYQGRVVGVEVGTALDWLHYVSAGVVSFTRDLNDAPKIAALLLLAPQLGGVVSTAIVGVAIGLGGAISARRVAETMGRRIKAMNHGEGFTANLLTAMIVSGASRLGLPVSTTHVSCGSLFGIGTVTRQTRSGTIATILVAWATTLPVGAILGAMSY
jgi:PiT family inorganic phosphate transporter